MINSTKYSYEQTVSIIKLSEQFHIVFFCLAVKVFQKLNPYILFPFSAMIGEILK